MYQSDETIEVGECVIQNFDVRITLKASSLEIELKQPDSLEVYSASISEQYCSTKNRTVLPVEIEEQYNNLATFFQYVLDYSESKDRIFLEGIPSGTFKKSKKHKGISKKRNSSDRGPHSQTPEELVLVILKNEKQRRDFKAPKVKITLLRKAKSEIINDQLNHQIDDIQGYLRTMKGRLENLSSKKQLRLEGLSDIQQKIQSVYHQISRQKSSRLQKGLSEHKEQSSYIDQTHRTLPSDNNKKKAQIEGQIKQENYSVLSKSKGSFNRHTFSYLDEFSKDY